MNSDEIKERIAESIDEFLKIYWDGKSFDNLFLKNMASHLMYKCGDILNTPDAWISIVERLPNRQEYLTIKEDDPVSLKRLEIAFQTDTIEYDIGYYDGYKWFNERGRKIQNVIAWKPFVLYKQ